MTNQTTHHLKTIPPYYGLVVMGVKTFEFRKNDRNFKTGDIIILEEYLPETNTYSGRDLKVIITYILENFTGIERDYCVLGIQRA